jgi:NADH:ubiquinone reductase (H+-translocating)
MIKKQPTIVIVGGGFAGLAAAKSLHAPVQVVLIDRANHHLFQPVLFRSRQSALAPNQIASPIRDILRCMRSNVTPTKPIFL